MAALRPGDLHLSQRSPDPVRLACRKEPHRRHGSGHQARMEARLAARDRPFRRSRYPYGGAEPVACRSARAAALLRYAHGSIGRGWAQRRRPVPGIPQSAVCGVASVPQIYLQDVGPGSMARTGGMADRPGHHCRSKWQQRSARASLRERIRRLARPSRREPPAEPGGKAALYVGPDTVTTHLAAAVGAPTVALFGPSNPVKWGPWPKGCDADLSPYRFRGTQFVGNVALVQGAGHCVPCLQEGCARHEGSESVCLQMLAAGTVIEAAEKLLTRTGVRA